MNIQSITESARRVLGLLEDYSGGHVGRREMLLDPILYGYLQGRFGQMQRQHWVQLHGRPRPHRIDFRSGGSNPVVLEFAVRPRDGASQLYGSQNRTELRKLCRVTNTSARLRVLLLLDRAADSIQKGRLEATYREVGSGPGNFPRHAVRVIYVHTDAAYHFPWRPYR